MNTVPTLTEDQANRLAFLDKLQTLTNRIHATATLDEIMLDLSQDICEFFQCDRLTLYTVSADRTRIESKVKTEMQKFKDFSLPINGNSIAGYCALSKRLINVRDVYDDAELKSYSPDLQFLGKVDQRTGYVTRQMLAAPLVNADNGELLGVIQLINNRQGRPFSPSLEKGVRELCKTLAIAFAQRISKPMEIRSKYDPLIADLVLSQAEMALAVRSARRKGLDLENVLIDEFQIQTSDIGKALSHFFGVPYEPFREDRVKPAEALKALKRDYVEHKQWLPVEESDGTMTILATDPDGVKISHVASDLFPAHELSYRVTTDREFRRTVDQFFGPAPRKAEPGASAPKAALTKEDMVDQAHALIAGALRALDGGAIDVIVRPGAEQLVTAEGADGELASVRGRIVIDFRITR